MAQVISYSHFTALTVPRQSWWYAWSAIESWKGYIQSIPGFTRVRFSARILDSGDVRLHVTTSWEYEEQLEEWLGGDWNPGEILSAIEPPAYDVTEEILEDLT